jgi:hypothetical protein
MFSCFYLLVKRRKKEREREREREREGGREKYKNNKIHIGKAILILNY